MPASRIAGTGRYLPAQVLTNEALAQRVDTSDEWIRTRTGIRQRHIAADGETTSDLATHAAREAIAAAGMQPDEIDLLIVATATPDMIFPSTACIVQDKLGIRNGGAAFDVAAVCSGFVYGLAIADKMVSTGAARNALVIGAEIYSRILDWSDRGTCVLFGDGAGAVVLVPSGGGPAIGQTVFGAVGSAAPFIYAPHDTRLIEMNGHETFKRAVATLVSNALETLAANGLELDDVALFVLHQANGRIITAVSEALGVAPERVIDAIGELGNTSAASIPLALAEARSRGLLHEGDRVLLGAVGAGFTWGATVIEWGQA